MPSKTELAHAPVSYNHTISGNDDNYNLSFINGVLQITPAPVITQPAITFLPIVLVTPPPPVA